jgi:hypothetical protein
MCAMYSNYSFLMMSSGNCLRDKLLPMQMKLGSGPVDLGWHLL